MRPVIAIVLTACTGGMYDPSTVEQEEGACVELEGRRFASANELECGRTPAGGLPCRWSLTFATRDQASSGFQWRYSDVEEAGQVECNAGAIRRATSGSRAIDATFDPETQTLVWDRQAYVLAP